MIKVGLLFAALGLACCSPRPLPRFASWEPMRDEIVPPKNRGEAIQRLRESYALWQTWRKAPAPSWLETGRAAIVDSPFRYTYVRAEQVSPVEVHFTLFEVEAEQIVLRALLSADPSQLSSFPRRTGEPRPIVSRWIERGAALGSHDDGAPLQTFGQQYAECERLVLEAGSRLPRLYFHPDGLLMHCGYPPTECANCTSASMLAISRFSVRSELPSDNAAAWLCETESGPVPPGTISPFMPADFACFAGVHPTRKRAPDTETTAGDICSIDPAACPPPPAGFGVAYWNQVRPMICSGWPTHTPRALEVGKTDPLGEWTFPVSSSAGVECSGGVGLRRVRVNLDQPSR